MNTYRAISGVLTAWLALTSPAGADLRVGSFNIENLGVSKMSKPGVVTELVTIVRSYDVLAVQEIVHKAQHTPYRFLDAVNDGAAHSYGMLLSERSGRAVDDNDSQEQYAFIYRTDLVRPAGLVTLYPDPDDVFQREPLAARFEVIASGESFVLITVHTDPDLALEEIEPLDAVNDWAEDVYPLEDDFITLGDFNAGEGYAKPVELDELAIREPGEYTWVIADGVNTTTGASVQAHDRIVLQGPIAERVTGAGVDLAFEPHEDEISDHWPVFVTLAIDGAPEGPSATIEAEWDTLVAPVGPVAIAALLPNPEGADRGAETVRLFNITGDAEPLGGWVLQDSAGLSQFLVGSVAGDSFLDVTVGGGGFLLRNTGDTISLIDPSGAVVHSVRYGGAGAGVVFGP